MTTKSYRQKFVEGRWVMVPVGDVLPTESKGPYVRSDIEPYRTIATADMPVISGRAAERAYMKANGFIKFEEMESMPKHPREARVDPRIKEELIARFNH